MTRSRGKNSSGLLVAPVVIIDWFSYENLINSGIELSKDTTICAKQKLQENFYNSNIWSEY